MRGHIDPRLEVGESSITGPYLIKDTSEKVGLIRKRLLTTLLMSS